MRLVEPFFGSSGGEDMVSPHDIDAHATSIVGSSPDYTPSVGVGQRMNSTKQRIGISSSTTSLHTLGANVSSMKLGMVVKSIGQLRVELQMDLDLMLV